MTLMRRLPIGLSVMGARYPVRTFEIWSVQPIVWIERIADHEAYMSAAVQYTPSYSDPGERRENSRFPFREEVRYRLLNRTAIGPSGAGETVNMSSSGVLFSTQEQLPWGQLVEVAVNWPAKLDGACALKLVAVGRVVRSERFQSAVRIEKYEFKTRRAL